MDQLPIIPYFQTSRYRVQTMVELANPQPREKMADLGSGDGRILITFAQKGIEAHGYELDNSLLKKSQENIEKAGLSEKITVHNKDFWHEDLSQFQIVTIYPMPDIMEALEQKLQTELPTGSRILLNYYPFPHWKYAEVKDHIYLYKK